MVQIIQTLGTFLSIAIFARVILTWFPTQTNNPIVVFIYAITEPILAPIRRCVPKFGMLDLTPMIALILIIFIEKLLLSVLK
jgi:YggT family protein